MIVQQFCRTVDTQLAALPGPEEKLEGAVRALSQIFGIHRDEVAIFGYDERFDVLSFRWPERLRAAGVIPLSAPDYVVSFTARERKAVVDNNFANTPHFHIFEAMQLDYMGGIPIQKIMSAPLIRGEELIGAVQISHKGDTPEESGNDFTDADLHTLTEVAKVLAQHL